MPEPNAPRIVVLGSVHMDLIANAARLPAPGESVAGGVFAMAPGGKAGNQACQFALAGAEVSVMTRLGDDMFGAELLAALKERGVDTSLVSIDPNAPTGASTVLAAQGDYASVIAPGAAGLMSPDDVERARPAILGAEALVLQLEIAPAIVARAAEIAADAGRAVILNASPAPESWSVVPASLWRATSMLYVNRVEAGRLLGHGTTTEDWEANAATLADKLGVATVIVTLGAEGCVGVADGVVQRQAAFPATIADAVGAGDAFLGASALALIEGRPLVEALRRGAAAGAIAVSRSGVYEALPSRNEVDAFLARNA